VVLVPAHRRSGTQPSPEQDAQGRAAQGRLNKHQRCAVLEEGDGARYAPLEVRALRECRQSIVFTAQPGLLRLRVVDLDNDERLGSTVVKDAEHSAAVVAAAEHDGRTGGALQIDGVPCRLTERPAGPLQYRCDHSGEVAMTRRATTASAAGSSVRRITGLGSNAHATASRRFLGT